MRSWRPKGPPQSRAARRQFHLYTGASAPRWQCTVYDGKVFGSIVWPMRGPHGFGYDPIFMPEGFDITFGEMDPAKKHLMSHRARAFEIFVRECLEAKSAG